MMKGKNWKTIEFVLLLISSIFMVLTLANKLTVERTEITGNLGVYECELWKNSTVIYTHRVKLASGKKYFVRTKNIRCDDVKPPKIAEPVSLIIENNTIVSLSQDDHEILKYEILANNSERNSSILWFVTLVLVGATVWSGYQLKSYVKNGSKS